MCTFASIVLTKDNAFWALHDNHSQIIADNKLVETVAGRVTLVRIELTPPNNNYSAPLDQWHYRVDQDLLPEWYEPDATEERARRAFCELAAKRILREGKHEVCEGSYVVVDNATVTADGRATVTAYDNATVTADGRATVVQYGGTVELTAEAACVDRRGPCVVCHTAAPPL